jgi:phage gp46-like protein
MLDLATRPQPARTAAAAVFGVPFDLRLAEPLAPANYPWSDYGSPSGAPTQHVDVLATYALELEDTIQTAVILSLFTDRRAGADDKLPLNQTHRRGWVGEEFAADDFDARNDAWGSLLWLCYIGKATGDVLERARFAAWEALSWMVRNGLATRITVTAEWVGERKDRLAIRPAIYQGEQARPVYDVLWGTSITKGSA